MPVVFVFGNGLSCGLDDKLTTRGLTERVLTRLGPSYVHALEDLAALASPEIPDQPLGVDRGNFETLAGPVDRIAEAMTAIQALVSSTDATVLDGLRTASQELRLHYLRIVGTVLSEVDSCCVDKEGDSDRKATWGRMNEFAGKLVELHKADRVTVFTTNYDSIVMSSMLATGEWVYDGFRSGSLNVPMDRWPQNVALYHLHGSVAWIRDRNGEISKPSLEYVRAVSAIDDWAAGDPVEGWPCVVLGDLKTRQAGRFPFTLLYGELRAELARANLAVVGGYSFGDTPLNRELANYLALSPNRRLLVWNRSPNPVQILDRLQVQLLDTGPALSAEQLRVEAVQLPDSTAVGRVAELMKAH